MTEVANLEFLDPLGWLVDPADADAHLDVLQRPEFVVPVLGSGVSMPVGFPSGADLVTQLRGLATQTDFDPALQLPDPRSVADVLLQQGVDRGSLLRRVGSLFDGAPSATSPALDGLLAVPSRRLVTLNYDRSLETRAEELGIEYESFVLSSEAPTILERFAADSERDRLVIVHAHGIATDPESIVLDEQSYANLINAPLVTDWLRYLILGYRLLFIGTRVDELHLLYELKRLSILRRHNLLVASNDVVAELRGASRSALLPGTHALLIRGYTDHQQLVPLVELLARGRPSDSPVPATGPTFPLAAVAPPPDYVETLMVEHERSDDDFGASYLLGLRPHAVIPLDRMLVTGARTVVEGLPGSGKSTLLLEIGSRQPQGVTTLRLRASDLDLVGDPTLLLPRWLETAEAFREGESTNPLRLQTAVFHFLIDGLDEVEFGRQEPVVQRIAEVAGANSAHSFTIASRSVPALEGFDRSEWVHVVLEPSSEWRQAYLARREVEWTDLVEAAPLLNDLADLLNLPFFLSQTVDRFEAGELSETADMLSLVGRFVGASLDDIEGALSTEAVRTWLRRVALGMLLAGRSDVSVAEIAASLTDELRTYGDAVAIAERLVTAPLLRATAANRYGFVHRILGEALAAEALRDLDPEASRVLEVAAPVVTGSLKGLRSDWLVPLTLVASASAAWRQALAQRDPLAAARAVPVDADTDERRDAARVIWDQYGEWRVWINNYDRMSIVEDETVLARLLATAGLGELLDEVRAALTSDIRELVGNSMMVLANLGDRSIEPELRVILETNGDYVLRRMAGIAARDLQLDTLFYVIAHRALHPADTTEAQDMTYAAIDLADPNELPVFALRAARQGGEASTTLSYAFRGRLDRNAELAVLRARATRRAEPLSRERERLLEILPALDLSDPGIAESVVFVAGAWSVDSDEIRRVVREHPLPAARALIAVEVSEAAYNFELDWLLAELLFDDLVAAEAPESILDRKRAHDAWRAKQSDAT